MKVGVSDLYLVCIHGIVQELKIAVEHNSGIG